MDLAALEGVLRATPAGIVVVDPRLVRRVIKRHKHLPGLGLGVPHARCYAIRREVLLSIVSAEELGTSAVDLPDHVVLLPRPSLDEARTASESSILHELWRGAFHATVHIAISRKTTQGKLTDAMVRGRIHRIGQTEFDEIRRVLRNDDLLLPPHDDHSTYTEFAALYLELQAFAPHVLSETFPTLGEYERIDETLAQDVDARSILASCRPKGAPTVPQVHEAVASKVVRARGEPSPPRAVSSTEAHAMLALANVARARGNVVRSALLRLTAASVGGMRGIKAHSEAQADVEALAHRLEHALSPRGTPPSSEDAKTFVGPLLELARLASARGIFRRVEARLMFDLQKACLASERVIGRLDPVGFLVSFGRLGLSRMLDKTREVRVARALRAAQNKLPRVALSEASRARLSALLHHATKRAEQNVRATVRPVLHEVLREVGPKPSNVPEQVAADKVVEELLDQLAYRGYFSIGQLRDALSRSQFKLPDLEGKELLFGDALLRMDLRLSRSLDGVYRRGDVYLRGLQKFSSIFFGTPVGRALTQYALLPFGIAYVLLRGTALMLHEVFHLLGVFQHVHLHFDHPIPVAVTSAVFLGLLHSPLFRRLFSGFFRGIYTLLFWIFVGLPSRLLRLPLVLRIRRSRAMRLFRQHVGKPALLGLAVTCAMPRRLWGTSTHLVLLALLFALSSLALNLRVVVLAEEIALDAVGRTWRQFRKRVLPGLLRLVVDFFRGLSNGIDRTLYAIDDWLRFREGQSRLVVVAKAISGMLFGVLAYVFRIYWNVFIEPQVNPVKHFPVVTVSAKILVAFAETLLNFFVVVFTPLVGLRVAKILAPANLACIPGFFGFLVWELKENYRLYSNTRPNNLGAVAIGHHGETMCALMKPGFHSGTLPKLYTKLRRAVRKGDEAVVERTQHAMLEVNEAVERFVERELVALLNRAPRYQGPPLRVANVVLASNRVKVELAPIGEGASLVLCFEEQSGYLLASIAKPGFANGLGPRDRVIFENALAGLYKLAGVDMVREQIEAALADNHGSVPPYDISDEGLVVWPEASYDTELVYDLEQRERIVPNVRGATPPGVGIALKRERLMFSEQPVAWERFTKAFDEGSVARVLPRDSLLPPCSTFSEQAAPLAAFRAEPFALP